MEVRGYSPCEMRANHAPQPVASQAIGKPTRTTGDSMTPFTGVSLICPRCGRQVEALPGTPSRMVGTTLQYEHLPPCPADQARAWNKAGEGKQVILGGKA